MRIVILMLILTIQSESGDEKPRLAPERLAVRGIVMGESTLADVQGQFGPTPTTDGTYRNVAEKRLCYVAGGGFGISMFRRVFLVVASSAARTRKSEDIVTSIRFYENAAGKVNRARCRPAALKASELVTENGVRLGLGFGDFLDTLGEPRTAESEDQRDDWLEFSSCKDVPIVPEDPDYSRWSDRPECFVDESGKPGADPYASVCTTVVIEVRDGLVATVESEHMEFVLCD